MVPPVCASKIVPVILKRVPVEGAICGYFVPLFAEAHGTVLPPGGLNSSFATK